MKNRWQTTVYGSDYRKMHDEVVRQYNDCFGDDWVSKEMRVNIEPETQTRAFAGEQHTLDWKMTAVVEW